MHSRDISLFADYFQFYLQDESAPGDLSNAWTEEATELMLAIAPGTIGVGTVRNMTVPIALQVLDSEPALDLDAWDQVNECTLDVPSGRIVVAGCTDYFPEALRLEVPAGTYRARVSYGALATVSSNSLEGQDHYRVQLWCAPEAALRVLKRRVG